jgi:predicted short-subunit dehydrogenase-like oxidoreductase (DUF2520 family)
MKCEHVMLSRGMMRTVSIVGAGRVGRTLGKRLHELGWRIEAVVTRSKASARAAARAIGGGHALPGLAATIAEADVIILTTPDGALEATAEALARMTRARWRGKVVLHTSGALDCEVLAPLAALGAATGSLHPMQTFSGRGTPRLDGVIFAVEGHRPAQSVAKGIARSLGGVPVSICGRDKPIYHAAGALMASQALALVEAATQMLIEIGFKRTRAVEALLPLVRQMLDNFERLGARPAWTGPIAREDYATVRKHVDALRAYPRELQDSYGALALLAGRVLSRKPKKAIRQLKSALRKIDGG